MEERNFELDIRQWLDLSKGGKAKEAKDFYYENLFDTVIERFEKNNQQVLLTFLFQFLASHQSL